MEEAKPPQDEASSQTTPAQAWDDDPENPLNWPTGYKFRILLMISLSAFTAYESSFSRSTFASHH
jgi:hypothetical protein